jgi:hypothetical protein
MMNRLVRSISLFLFFMIMGTGGAGAIEGMRGATWGELRYDIPRDDVENMLLHGWVKQGIDWAKWGEMTLNTYAMFRYKWDSEGFSWNNTVGPGIGVSLDMYVPGGLSASLGVEYQWENKIIDDLTDRKTIVYLNWYGWWDLKNR